MSDDRSPQPRRSSFSHLSEVDVAPLIHVAALDVQAGYGEEFDRWYDREHLPSILSRPGWLAAHRYECLEGEPRHLTIFDLDISAAELADGISSSPLANERIGRRLRNYHARTYRLVSQRDEAPESPT